MNNNNAVIPGSPGSCRQASSLGRASFDSAFTISVNVGTPIESVISTKHDGAKATERARRDPEHASSAMPIRGVLPMQRGLRFCPRVLSASRTFLCNCRDGSWVEFPESVWKNQIFSGSLHSPQSLCSFALGRDDSSNKHMKESHYERGGYSPCQTGPGFTQPAHVKIRKISGQSRSQCLYFPTLNLSRSFLFLIGTADRHLFLASGG